ncbi:MAG: ATP-binding protein [Verrucomicrobia bacterium]|nr:ATP-binding protein [Verrucomicrobiota bacterium]
MFTDTEQTTEVRGQKSEVRDPNSEGAEAPSTTPRGNSARRFTISGDVIARAVAELPDREREAIKWLAGYCTAKNLSHREVAASLKKTNGEPYHPDSLYQAFTGRREAQQLAPLAEAIETLRKQVEENLVRLETEFIETAIARKIFALCDKARRRRKIALLYGESQIGKTTTFVVYKERHNHGETVYVRMPTRASLGAFLVELALVLNVSTQLKGVQLRRALLNCFDERMLLLVDEAHEGSVAALNFAREIHDRRKCGVVFAGTNVLRQALTTGAEARNFRQLVLRGLPPLLLPSTPPARDLAAFARAYDLGPAGEEEISARIAYVDDAGRDRTQTVTLAPAELQRQVVGRDGLGRWCAVLQEARDLAREKRRPLTWGGVIAAWHSFDRLSRVEEEEAS